MKQWSGCHILQWKLSEMGIKMKFFTIFNNEAVTDDLRAV